MHRSRGTGGKARAPTIPNPRLVLAAAGTAGASQGFVSRAARIGDGQLNYRPEQILEAYYAYSLNRWATLTFDYQFIDNPGYNADRGPVSVFSGRLHAQF